MTSVGCDRLGRIGGLSVVMLGHAGLVWALLPGAEMPPAPAAEAPVLEARLIDDTAPSPVVQASPPLPEPERPKPRPRVATRVVPKAPTPVPSMSEPAATSAATQASSEVAAAPAVAVAPTRPPTRQPAVISCRTPSYPPSSRQAGETGTVLLQLLIDLDGKVIDRRVERSSGFLRLDEAALAGLASCTFQPAASDGRSQPTWARLRYVWKLE